MRQSPLFVRKTKEGANLSVGLKKNGLTKKETLVDLLRIKTPRSVDLVKGLAVKLLRLGVKCLQLKRKKLWLKRKELEWVKEHPI